VQTFLTQLCFLQIQQVNLYKTGELTNGNVPVEASIGRCFEDVLKQSDFIAEYQRIEEFNKYECTLEYNIKMTF
jgi:hypothetical protein